MSMKELMLQLETLADSFVKELDSKLSIDIAEEIKKLLLLILIEGEGKFGAIVSQKLLDKLVPNEEFLVDKSTRRMRNDGSEIFLNKLHITRELIGFIFSEYEKQLTGTKEYTKYKLSVIEQIQSILDPESFILENVLWFSTNRYKAEINSEKSRILLYFNERSINNPEAYKNELFLFVYKLNNKIHVADELINHAKKNRDKYYGMLISGDYLTELENTNETTSTDDPSEQNKPDREYKHGIDEDILSYYASYEYDETDLKEHYTDLFLEADDEYKNRLEHKKMMIDLLDELRSTHLILANYASSESIPTTVFGSLNYDAMGLFYKELKYFLPATVSQKQIFEIFSISNQPSNVKIELTSGSLNDYGYLMNELQPFFVPQLKPNNKYDQWWSDRFVFSSVGTFRVEKNARAIAKLRSASRKGRSNSVSKKAIIASIVNQINKDPH